MVTAKAFSFMSRCFVFGRTLGYRPSFVNYARLGCYNSITELTQIFDLINPWGVGRGHCHGFTVSAMGLMWFSV